MRECVIRKGWVQMRYIQMKIRSWPVPYWGQRESIWMQFCSKTPQSPKSVGVYRTVIGQWERAEYCTATVLRCPACMPVCNRCTCLILSRMPQSCCCCKWEINIEMEPTYNWRHLSFMTDLVAFPEIDGFVSIDKDAWVPVLSSFWKLWV